MARICRFALAWSERDVGVGEGEFERDDGWRGRGLYFTEKFDAPADYPRAPGYDDDDEHAGFDRFEQYWRGWLAGVKKVFERVKDHLPPIEPPTETIRSNGGRQTIPASEPSLRDVDPDEIPF